MSDWVIVCSTVTVALEPGAKLAIGLPTILPASAFASVMSMLLTVTLPVLVTTISYSITSPKELPLTVTLLVTVNSGLDVMLVTVGSFVGSPSVLP